MNVPRINYAVFDLIAVLMFRPSTFKTFSIRALFEDADTDNSGTISFDELKSELEKHPGVIENLTIR